MNGRVTITRQDTAETLEIDNVTTAGLGFQWAVTAHPRESGLPVTDSTTPLPTSLQISGIVSGLDIDGAGLVGEQRFARLRQWLQEGYAALWIVDVPGKFNLVDALVVDARIETGIDGKIDISISVRHTAIVDAQTVARISAVQTGAGSSGSQRVPYSKPPASTEADLAEEQQDGTLPGSVLDTIFTLAGFGG